MATTTRKKNAQVGNTRDFEAKSPIERRENPFAERPPKKGPPRTIDTVACVVEVIIHLATVYTFIYVPLTWKLAAWSGFYLYITGLTFTAGHHRLWSHRAYKARLPLQAFLHFFGNAAVFGSAMKFARQHRTHHRFTDSDLDPYNALKGYWYCHIGWTFYKEDWSQSKTINTDDLTNDKLTVFNDKYYPQLTLLMAIVFPTLVSWMLLGDFLGGLFWAGFARTCIGWHMGFSINSAAHYFGHATYDDVMTPRDNFFVALLTFGEGYHNFHHEFPDDYRNGIRWWHYDPTKWFVYAMSHLGLAYDLQRFSGNEIDKGEVLMDQAKLNERKAKLKWGKHPSDLPIWSMEKLRDAMKDDPNRILIVINCVVHDVTKFSPRHPGGKYRHDKFNGKDATAAFNGGVYNHTNAARNLLSQYGIATLSPETKLL